MDVQYLSLMEEHCFGDQKRRSGHSPVITTLRFVDALEDRVEEHNPLFSTQ